MVTEKSSNLSKQRLDLPQEKGSGTNCESSEEHLPKITYRKDLSWPHSDDEPRLQEKQQVKDQQSCIFIFVASLTILATRGTSPEIAIVFHT